MEIQASLTAQAPDVECHRDSDAISGKTLETSVLTTYCLEVGEMRGKVSARRHAVDPSTLRRMVTPTPASGEGDRHTDTKEH